MWRTGRLVATALTCSSPSSSSSESSAYRGVSRVLAIGNPTQHTRPLPPMAIHRAIAWRRGTPQEPGPFPLALVVSEYLLSLVRQQPWSPVRRYQVARPRHGALYGWPRKSCGPPPRRKYGSRADLVGERVSDNYGGSCSVHRSTAWAATAAAFAVLCIASNRTTSRLRVCGCAGLVSQAGTATARHLLLTLLLDVVGCQRNQVAIDRCASRGIALQ